MSLFHYLLIFGIPGAILFVIFSKEAKKVGKNSLMWGAVGALVYIGAMVILGPILLNNSRDAIGRVSDRVAFSYSLLAFVLSIGAAVAVYKFVLVKKP